MKNSLVLLGLAALAAGTAQAEHKLTQLWESQPALKVPESVRFDAKRKVLYVTNIDGEPWAVDGKGSVGKVGLDGKVIAAEWITGLHCPKGTALSDDGELLYVADNGGIVVVDIDAGKIARKIAIEGAQLNDLVNDAGTLYVSDSKGRKVYVVKKGKAEVLLDDKVLKGPNGLLVHDGKLLVLDNDGMSRVKADKTLEVLATGMPGGADGIEHVGSGEFLVSVWSGALWYVKGDGSKELLFDGKAAGTHTADIGWDPATQTVYVPTFFRNTVIAYKVE
jgi:DNA-binding beta-propeller fold protein YncE